MELEKNDFIELLHYAKAELELTDKEISELPSLKHAKKITSNWQQKYGFIILWLGPALLAAFVALVIYSCKHHTELGATIVKLYLEYAEDITDGEALGRTECLLETPEPILDWFRPLVDCNECKDVVGPIYVSNISTDEFVQKYAFSMQPVVIQDGQSGWTAKDVFSYDYFKELYRRKEESDEEAFIDVCQFFPYKTPLVYTMKDFLTMPEERFNDSRSPWYVGWSNCNVVIASELRKHYKEPYFIPDSLDHAKTDWIFMGMPGYGAHLHIDSVDTMSWQAQIKGKKQWVLESPPECHSICTPHMELIVEPGNIVVLDTNKWFHSTRIIGEDISIVIGSEYF